MAEAQHVYDGAGHPSAGLIFTPLPGDRNMEVLLTLVSQATGLISILTLFYASIGVPFHKISWEGQTPHEKRHRKKTEHFEVDWHTLRIRCGGLPNFNHDPSMSLINTVDRLQERCQAGLKAARVRGRLEGQKQIGSDGPRTMTAKRLRVDRHLSTE